MAFKGEGKIWFSGKLVDWNEANIHVCSHVVHYGSSLFEGDRCYNTKKGPAAFRLMDHIKRLFDSCKIYRMDPPFTMEQVHDACLETIRANNMKDCYIRPIVFRGYNSLGVNPFPCPIEVAIAVWEWGKYLGEEALEKGVDVKISTWTRMAPNTFPAMAKCGANYMNSQLIKMEAIKEGYVEGISLDTSGHACEGSGENLFMVRNGVIYTPPLSGSILPGITRDCVMKIAKDSGYEVLEQSIPREALYIADEVFLTGSAAEITPVRSIDKITVGQGARGPVTKRIQDELFAYIMAEKEDKYKWLTFVYD